MGAKPLVPSRSTAHRTHTPQPRTSRRRAKLAPPPSLLRDWVSACSPPLVSPLPPTRTDLSLTTQVALPRWCTKMIPISPPCATALTPSTPLATPLPLLARVSPLDPLCSPLLASLELSWTRQTLPL